MKLLAALVVSASATLLAPHLATAEVSTPTTSAATTEVATSATPATPGFIGIGVGMSMDVNVAATVSVEGGVRLFQDWLYGHAQASLGEATFVFESQTRLAEARGGLEAQHCTVARTVCGFAGVDAGYVHMSSDSEELAGVLVAPRLGIDAGGRHLRFRGAVEGRSFTAIGAVEYPDDESAIGLGVTLGVAGHF